jgi:hypothetical protein
VAKNAVDCHAGDVLFIQEEAAELHSLTGLIGRIRSISSPTSQNTLFDPEPSGGTDS